MARVAVIGAGVVGVASAYMLCKAGHQVTLVDRNAVPCSGASVRNGAQLSYAYGDALASPSLLKHLPGILLGRDPAYRVRLHADPEFLIWGLRFLANTSSARYLSNTRYLLQMAADTRSLLRDVLDEFQIGFDYTVSGKMILFPTAASFAAAQSGHALKTSMGIRQQMLSRDEATAIEPALAHYRDEIAGVVYSPDDAAGRPSEFCAQLIGHLTASYGLRTRYQCEAERLLTRKGRVHGVMFRNYETLDCDAVVIATGYGTKLSAPFSPAFSSVWPVQGYSVTLPATEGAMQTSITDLKRKMVFARLGDQVRIAGMADIGRRRFAFEQDRFAALKDGAQAAFARGFASAEGQDAQSWSDARPCTPSSRPIIAPGKSRGVFLNYGHGTLGWTLCLGSAARLQEVMRDHGL